MNRSATGAPRSTMAATITPTIAVAHGTHLASMAAALLPKSLEQEEGLQTVERLAKVVVNTLAGSVLEANP